MQEGQQGAVHLHRGGQDPVSRGLDRRPLSGLKHYVGHKPHTVPRSRCVVRTVTPSTATAWSPGSASVTWATRAPAAGTASSCLAASTGTAPRASPVTASPAGAGCSVMCRSVSSAGRGGCVWPRGSVSVSLVTGGRTAVSAPRPPGVSTGPAARPCSATVSPAGRGSCATLQCAQTRAVRSTAHAQSQARVGVISAGPETRVTRAWLTQAVLTETATSPTTVTVSRDGRASSATSPRLWSLGLVPGR